MPKQQASFLTKPTTVSVFLSLTKSRKSSASAFHSAGGLSNNTLIQRLLKAKVSVLRMPPTPEPIRFHNKSNFSEDELQIRGPSAQLCEQQSHRPLHHHVASTKQNFDKAALKKNSDNTTEVMHQCKKTSEIENSDQFELLIPKLSKRVDSH